MGLIVPAIRIGERYLVGEDRRLHLKLDLPTVPDEMNINPVRYESMEEEIQGGYLIGVRIEDMNPADRARFAEYVGQLNKQGGR